MASLLEHDANGDNTSGKQVGTYGKELDEGDEDDYDDLDSDEFVEEMSTE